MAQTLVAMEVLPDKVRLAVVESTFRESRLTRVETIALAEGETLEQALPRVRDCVGDNPGTIVLACDPFAVAIRRFAFPLADQRRVESALTFELESVVPQDLDTLATTWSVVSREGGQTVTLSAVTPKAPLLTALETMERYQLAPRSVLPPAAALPDLLPPGDAGAQRVGLLVLGHRLTHIALCRNRELELARTVWAGGIDVDRSLAKAFGVSMADAKTAKEREARIVGTVDADPHAAKVSQAVIEGLGPLLSQVAATLRSLPEELLPERLVITGGLSRLPGLSEHITDELGVPCEVLPMSEAARRLDVRPPPKKGHDRVAPEGTAHSEIEVGGEHAVVVALALSALRRGRALPLNFRRGDLAYQGDLHVYRGHVVRFATGLAAVLLLGILGSVVRYSMVSAHERQLDAGFCETTKRIVGREICNPTQALAVMRQPQGADGLIIPTYSAADILDMMSKVIPPDVDVSFEVMDIRLDPRPEESDRVTAKGEAGSFESTGRMVEILTKTPCVQEAEVSKQQKSKTAGKVDFNLSVQIECPAGVTPGGGVQVVEAGQ